MAIRLSGHAKYPEIDATMADAGEYAVRTVYGQGIRLAYANTREEAEQARRAFENVLAPRFTRDEAIAAVKVALDHVAEDMASDDYSPNSPEWTARVAGARLALEALAAAGVFSDECRDGPCRACSPAMAAKLDAAGIR